MRSVGVRDLRENLSQILREVSGSREEISITSYGREVARLVPPRKRKAPDEMAELWERIDRISAEIGKHPARGVAAVDAVREERE
jgi:prevent-host-death family protein